MFNLLDFLIDFSNKYLKRNKNYFSVETSILYKYQYENNEIKDKLWKESGLNLEKFKNEE